jgi:creatinine amidohydrolase/Fe(II)-dependent formamide hydrolase-like protein
MPATTRSGVVGHARRASAEDGKALAEMLVDDLTEIVKKALVEPWPEVPGPA